MLAIVSLAVLFAPVVITGDLDTAYQKLKDATAGKDVVQVKILAAQTCALAREAISAPAPADDDEKQAWKRSEEHTSELQSLRHLVCRLLLEKKKKQEHQL